MLLRARIILLATSSSCKYSSAPSTRHCKHDNRQRDHLSTLSHMFHSHTKRMECIGENQESQTVRALVGEMRGDNIKTSFLTLSVSPNFLHILAFCSSDMSSDSTTTSYNCNIDMLAFRRKKQDKKSKRVEVSIKRT